MPTHEQISQLTRNGTTSFIPVPSLGIFPGASLIVEFAEASVSSMVCGETVNGNAQIVQMISLLSGSVAFERRDVKAKVTLQGECRRDHFLFAGSLTRLQRAALNTMLINLSFQRHSLLVTGRGNAPPPPVPTVGRIYAQFSDAHKVA